MSDDLLVTISIEGHGGSFKDVDDLRDFVLDIFDKGYISKKVRVVVGCGGDLFSEARARFWAEHASEARKDAL